MRLMAKTADMLYHAVLTELVTNATRTAPRGMGTREVVASHLTLTNPNANIITLPTRKLNYPFMVAEWLYIMSGGNYDKLITPFNRNIGSYAEDGHFSGAYGPKVLEQLGYVREVLRNDGATRQAVLTIWRERPRSTKDVPCTVMMQFLIRDERLHMIVYMRSNDAWLGMPYDIFNFTQIQRQVAFDLGIPVGYYHHMVGSLHLYDSNYEAASKLVQEDDKHATIEHQQAPFTAMPVVEAVGALFDIAVQRPGVTPEFVGGWNSFDSQWRGYIETLCWKFNKQVVPRTPWAPITSGRSQS